MARTRRSADVEARSARVHAVNGLLAGLCAAALWLVITRYLPADWTWPSEEERDRILLIGGGGLLALGVLRWSAAAFHGMRWVRARRWERMLRDPTSAHLVPPLREHVKSVVRASELGLRAAALAMVVAAVGLVIVALEFPHWTEGPEGESGPVLFAGLLAWGSVRSWRDAGRRRLARRIEAISAAGVITDAAAEEPVGDVSTSVPELTITFAVSGEPGTAHPTFRVVPAHGGPRHVLYLRLFDNAAGTARLLAGAWPRRGYVHLLRSADQVTPEELEAAKDNGSIESMFISSAQQLDDALARQATGRYDPPPPTGILAMWRGLRDRRRGTYPVRALLCHGSFWKQAIDLLLPRMDHVVLDLTGYRPERTGTRYEMQRLIDTYPIGNVSIISDRQCDRAFLTAQITWAWRHMAAGSPNEGPDARTITVRLPVLANGRR